MHLHCDSIIISYCTNLEIGQNTLPTKLVSKTPAASTLRLIKSPTMAALKFTRYRARTSRMPLYRFLYLVLDSNELRIMSHTGNYHSRNSHCNFYMFPPNTHSSGTWELLYDKLLFSMFLLFITLYKYAD